MTIRKTRKKDKPAAPAAEGKTTTAGPVEGSAEERRAAEESLRTKLEELEEELERVKAEAETAADRALRTLAEFDNYRRRSEKDREAAVWSGESRVLVGLLDVADNFDRALEHAGDDVPEAFLEGMQLVARGLHDLLNRHGVTRVEAVGAPFDPEVHEALTSQPSEEVPPNTVLQEIQPGYTMGGRVLRPAKVIVAAAMSRDGDSPGAEEDEGGNELSP